MWKTDNNSAFSNSSFASGLGLGDGPPQLTAAIDACWSAVQRLTANVASADNPAHGSRDLIRRETGVDVDANPYHGLTRDKLEAVIRAGCHSRAMPEVLLAKWAKEGSTNMTLTATAVGQASTEANARTLLRSSLYFQQLGVDWLTSTRRPDPHADNVLDETDAGAPAQERQFASRVAELVRDGVLAEDITALVNAQLAVSHRGPSISVQPSVRFYALSLLLVDAVFSRFLRIRFPLLPGTTSEALGYMLWNMGEAGFQAFLTSADQHRREPAFAVSGQPITVERWALHTPPRASEFAQVRRNAIRFMHYVRSYQPIFQGAMNLIRPGAATTHGRAAVTPREDPLGLGMALDTLSPLPRMMSAQTDAADFSLGVWRDYFKLALPATSQTAPARDTAAARAIAAQSAVEQASAIGDLIAPLLLQKKEQFFHGVPQTAGHTSPAELDADLKLGIWREYFQLALQGTPQAPRSAAAPEKARAARATVDRASAIADLIAPLLAQKMQQLRTAAGVPQPPATTHGLERWSASMNGESRPRARAESIGVISRDFQTFTRIGLSAVEAPAFSVGAKSWDELAFFSRARIGGYAEMRTAGWVTDDGADGFLVRIRGRFVAPADLAQRSGVPLVVICMGQHPASHFPDPASTREIDSYLGYDYLQRALADLGCASISVDTNPANAVNGAIRTRAEMILATVDAFRATTDATLAPLVGKVSFNNVGLVGHSRGGEAVVFATKLNVGRAPHLGIKAVASIAPTDLSRGVSSSSRRVALAGGAFDLTQASLAVPAAPAAADGVRYFVLYGSHDGDVAGDGDNVTAPVGASASRIGTGFSLYDRATCPKTLVFARGITHNRFNTKWIECADYADHLHAFVEPDTATGMHCMNRVPGTTFDPFIFSAASHQNLAVFYIGAFMDCVLNAATTKEAILRGEHALNRDHAIVIDFQNATDLRLDGFAGAAVGPLPAPGGGSIVDTFGIPHCPHEARAFSGTAGNRVKVTVPPGARDVRARRAISLRVGAAYTLPDSATIAHEPKPAFTVRVESASGIGTATDHDISTTGVLTPDRPYFHRVNLPFLGNVTKLHLDTVVIPLAAFGRIDRSDLRSIEIEIGASGTTPVIIDSISLV